MSFCKHANRKILDSEVDKWHKGVIEYKKTKDAYLYDFSNEDRLDKNDNENTFLAQMIYWEMAKRIWPNCKINIAQDKQHRGNRVKFENGEDKNIWFYADVMHNAIPNKNKCKLATILGNDSNVRKDWEKVYHTIGNFVLVPDYYPNRQINLIHRDKNEWWDLVLQYMKDTWEYDGAISIQDYIIFTMQQLYVDSIFQPLYAELKGKTFEEFINNYNWEEKIVEWDKEISDKNISELNFIDIHSIGAEEAANRINFLIRLRGYIICSLLTDEKDVLNMNYNV